MAHNDDCGLVHSLAMTLRVVILHLTVNANRRLPLNSKAFALSQMYNGLFSICNDVNEATQMNVPIRDLHPRLDLNAADENDCAEAFDVWPACLALLYLE